MDRERAQQGLCLSRVVSACLRVASIALASKSHPQTGTDHPGQTQTLLSTFAVHAS